MSRHAFLLSKALVLVASLAVGLTIPPVWLLRADQVIE